MNEALTELVLPRFDEIYEKLRSDFEKELRRVNNNIQQLATAAGVVL